MRQILLDTNFILSCIRNKIDLFEELFLEGYKIIIPEQILNEIKKFENKKTEAGIAMKILEKEFYEKPDLGKGIVDKKIIAFAKENPKIIIATLDKEIRSKISNDKMIIRNGKKLEIL